MFLIIKYMRSERCKMIVAEELTKLNIPYKNIELGEVELNAEVHEETLQILDSALRKYKLALMINNKSIIVKKIKEAVTDLVYCTDGLNKPNFSEFISDKVNHDYNYLSKTFSDWEGKTIEKYFIEQRIERVKVMLFKDKASLNEIAYKMLYSSVAHLSNQFKKVTGVTPYQFRQLHSKESRLNKSTFM
jgi:AraC-like DNA-binding protein